MSMLFMWLCQCNQLPEKAKCMTWWIMPSYLNSDGLLRYAIMRSGVKKCIDNPHVSVVLASAVTDCSICYHAL